jgi:hypothetical protein
MGKTVDEVLLQMVKLLNFDIVDKDDEETSQDEPDQNRENDDDHPGLQFKELARVKRKSPDHRPQAGTDRYIPVDVKEE